LTRADVTQPLLFMILSEVSRLYFKQLNVVINTNLWPHRSSMKWQTTLCNSLYW